MVFLRLALLFEDGSYAISRRIRVLCLVPMSRQCLVPMSGQCLVPMKQRTGHVTACTF